MEIQVESRKEMGKWWCCQVKSCVNGCWVTDDFVKVWTSPVHEAQRCRGGENACSQHKQR